MKGNHFKYYRPNIIITVIAGLGIALFLGLKYTKLPLSVFATIGLLVLIIDQWLWKLPPFKWLFWTDDFSGRYDGYLEYEFRDNDCVTRKGKLKHMKIIQQKGSSITIRSYTYAKDGKKSSKSKSEEVAVQKEEDGHYKLIYTYENSGNPQLGYPVHYGTEVIEFIKGEKEQKLTGHYYTSRMPQTRGVFSELEYKGNDLTPPF